MRGTKETLSKPLSNTVGLTYGIGAVVAASPKLRPSDENKLRAHEVHTMTCLMITSRSANKSSKLSKTGVYVANKKESSSPATRKDRQP